MPRTCLDCPEPVVKPMRGPMSLRCPECQAKHRAEYMRQYRRDWDAARRRVAALRAEIEQREGAAC